MLRKIRDTLLFAQLAGLLLTPPQWSLAAQNFRNLEHEVQALLAESVRSVVTVSASFSHEVPAQSDGGLLSLFKKETERKSVSYVNIGSGLIIDTSGHVITRSSIVMGAREIQVERSGGKNTTAMLVADDPESGFSLLRIEAQGIVPARFGDSDNILLGSWNLMVGNSLGVFPSVVFGSISGISDDGLIHFTANLNPGNNGSPLINMDGEVVALVAGRMTAADGGTGIPSVSTAGMAYPINWIKKIVGDLVADKPVQKGWLGVVGYHDGHNTRIRDIKADSPAQKAGLQPGDVIVSFNRQEVKSVMELARLVRYSSPGHEVMVGYLRDGEPAETSVLMGEKISASATQVSKSPPDNHIRAEQPVADIADQHEMLELRIRMLENEVRKLRKLIEVN
jgi:serine protease Do